jgi:hypothetical protein
MFLVPIQRGIKFQRTTASKKQKRLSATSKSYNSVFTQGEENSNSNERNSRWKIHNTPWQSAVESPRKRIKAVHFFIKFGKLVAHTRIHRASSNGRRESDIQISLVGQIDVKLGPFTCSWCKIDWIAVTFVFRDKKKLNFAWWKMLTRDNRLSKHTPPPCHESFMCLMPRRRRRHRATAGKSIVAVIMNVW